MGFDRDRILVKISYINEQMRSIEDLLSKKTRGEIVTDPWLIRGLKYSMQTSVEAMIDLCYHISAKKFGVAPGDARDALRVLTEGGVINKENVPVYSAMIGFRNRIVHGYQHVSDERVYEMAVNELGDFNKFINEISTILI